MMRPGHTSRARLRTFVLVCGCAAAGAIAAPGVSLAEKTIQEVFVTNTGASAVPVTVANQVKRPMPFQKHFTMNATLANGHAIGQHVFNVPAGKTLTIEFAQMFFRDAGTTHRVLFIDECSDPREDGTLDPFVISPPATPSTDEIYSVHGGPVKVSLPAGGCLRAFAEFVPDDPTANIHIRGTVSGFLEDAPTG